MKTRRQPVDWDAEIRKTEKIQRRGFIMSAVSFAFAVAVIFGMRQFGGVEIGFPRKVLSIVCLIAACFVFRAAWRHRAKWKRERQKQEQKKREREEA